MKRVPLGAIWTRFDPVLPLSPGRAERHGFEYYRHGTLSLYAALDVRTGPVVGKTSARHTSAEFVAFLADVVATQSADKEIHIIVDNLSAQKTKRVVAFLAEHPTVAVHYTPTYSSWLNQVEIWFSKIQRDLIARGIFESRNDLKRKIMRYIRCHNANAKPFKWTYRNTAPSHHPLVFTFQKLTALANYQVVSCWVFAVRTSEPLQCGQVVQAVDRQHPTRCSAPSGVQISTAPKE